MIIAALITCTATCIAQDKWQPNPKYIKKDTGTHKPKGDKYQCLGTTQKGLRCRRMTLHENEYCYQHKNQK